MTVYRFRLQQAGQGMPCDLCGTRIGPGEEYWRFTGGQRMLRLCGRPLPRTLCPVCHQVYDLPGEDWSGGPEAAVYVHLMTSPVWGIPETHHLSHAPLDDAEPEPRAGHAPAPAELAERFDGV